MKSLIKSGSFLLLGIGLLATGATGAYFSDIEDSTGNTLASGVVDLKVDNESYYNGEISTTTTWLVPTDLDGHLFFDFRDLKPDDEGEDTIGLTVHTNDAWACMELTLTSDDDLSSNEPELKAGDPEDDPDDIWDGELADHLEFVWWADDGDNVYEDGEYVLSDGVETLTELATTSGPFVVALADSATNVWTGAPGQTLTPGETYHIGKAWCFGTLTFADPLFDQEDAGGPLVRGTGVECDGTWIGNALQTDGVTLDTKFTAMQARHDSQYLCPNDEVIIPCDPEFTYADTVVSYDQGTRKNNLAVAGDRSDPTKALGAPQHPLGLDYDSPTVAGSWFSLGFADYEGDTEIVLSFDDNVVINEPGVDLKLWEVTGGNAVTSPYPDERVDVYLGNTPTGPWTLVGDDVTRDAEIDIDPVPAARYVRIVDASDEGLFELEADGYDLDAVQALSCAISPIN